MNTNDFDELRERIDKGVKKAIHNSIMEHFRQGRSIAISENGEIIFITEKEYLEKQKNETVF